MKHILSKIFKKDENIIIGAIHFPPLFGYKDFPGLDIALKNALYDLKAFEDGGVDGIIIENNYDLPHKVKVEQGTINMMIQLGREIRKMTKLPIGVSVLWNDYEAAFSIAKSIEGQFVRVPVFIDDVVTDYGEIYANPEKVIECRKKLDAEEIALFTDIHVKHAKLLKENTIEESAVEAIKRGSDAIIITGKWTGDAPNLTELKNVRNAIGSFPILIGSGTDESNVKDLLQYADGVIVSTSLKEGERVDDEVNVKPYQKRVQLNKVKDLISSF